VRIEQTYPGIGATKGKSGKSKSSFTKATLFSGAAVTSMERKMLSHPRKTQNRGTTIGQVQSAEPVQTHQPQYRFQQIFTVH
jgi:hypothetical protein